MVLRLEIPASKLELDFHNKKNLPYQACIIEHKHSSLYSTLLLSLENCLSYI